jgi:hypothetical protein
MDLEIALVLLSCYSRLIKAGVHKSWTIKFRTETSKTCGSSVRTLLHVNILVPTILRCLPVFFLFLFCELLN